LIEIALGKSESLLDAQPGSPHDHDESAWPAAARSIAGGAHDGDEFFDLRRIGRVPQTLVVWSVARVESRDRRRRSTSTCTILQKLGHDPSSGSWHEPDDRPPIHARPSRRNAALSLPTVSSDQGRSATSIACASERYSIPPGEIARARSCAVL
jgi:hypothetical protein